MCYKKDVLLFFFICFKKLTSPFEVCKLYGLCKLYQSCKLNELRKLYALYI